MKLVLVQVPFPCNTRHKKVLPLCILYLASFLRQELEYLDIAIIDGQALNIKKEALLRLILDEEPDVVGFGYWTLQADSAQLLSNEIKNEKPDVYLYGI